MTKKIIDTSTLFKTSLHISKYQTYNPISKFLVRNFFSNILKIVEDTKPNEVHEVGCGEGQILGFLSQNNINVFGSDISEESLEIARQESLKRGLSLRLINKSIYELDSNVDSTDTVLCCEVLEHLEYPERALKNLLSITKNNLILSVPREPIWSMLNILRGKYLLSFGNTPGHINHWSKYNFIKLISKYSKINLVRTPLPWIIIRCNPIE
jgi:2-polyprenyl-3-methyl-5-hydroxy-6-metoxy-1,4-benzoquinol methylase